MKVSVHGVRGSRPTPGAAFVRYGGNTSCIAISTDDQPPDLILDAGTGLAGVAGQLGDDPFRGTILLSHLHWDHVQGLPFFAPADRPDAEVELLMPAQGDPVTVLSRGMSPPHFPISPEELRGTWQFGALEAGEHAIRGYSVLAADVPHKGGRTFGYRVTSGSFSIAYVSDHAPALLGVGPDGFGPVHEAVLSLAAGVDLLFHDAQYTAAEFGEKPAFGHSSIDYAMRLADDAGVRHLILHHHDPGHDDAFLDELEQRTSGDGVSLAREGTWFDLASSRSPVEVS